MCVFVCVWGGGWLGCIWVKMLLGNGVWLIEEGWRGKGREKERGREEREREERREREGGREGGRDGERERESDRAHE